MPDRSRSENIQRFLINLDDELNGAALYDAVSKAEKDANLSELYRRLAAVERRHAEMWKQKIVEAGAPVPRFKPNWRTRTLCWIAGRFGPNAVLPSVVNAEQIGSRKYASQPDAAAMDHDERSHARILKHLTRTSPEGMAGPQLARIEGRHRATGGNALRAAVLGANDGLVSNLSLVMAVAGASLPSETILLTGIAGLLAGAGSMALGEWLSVQSSRELYEHQIETERDEIEQAPEEEAEELALIYQSRGMEPEQARMVANEIMSNSVSAIETMAREELGIDPHDLGGSAWTAAFTSFFLFAGGAILPVLPFIALEGRTAVLASVAVSTVGLFVVGAGVTLFTGRSILFSGGRQVLFGLVAAAITFGLGRLLGVAITG
ncbi:MAG TPA: VIT1/CCC1 transporter family protein [Thermoanaerobaculia bacterium]|nr:VIT1/CCC1 transporter family protein [Thermoanaerobaculia bacterium]